MEAHHKGIEVEPHRDSAQVVLHTDLVLHMGFEVALHTDLVAADYKGLTVVFHTTLNHMDLRIPGKQQQSDHMDPIEDSARKQQSDHMEMTPSYCKLPVYHTKDMHSLLEAHTHHNSYKSQ